MTLKNKSVKKAEEVLTQVDFSAIDANEPAVVQNNLGQVSVATTVEEDEANKAAIADLISKVATASKQAAPEAMGAVDPAEYLKKHPGVTVTPSSDKKAYQGPITPRQREDIVTRLNARTATDADLANLDESMIMDLPFIKASDYSIPGQYSPKPIDPAVRFRWVNCVNALQSNMQRFLALGFTMATPDDVDQVKTPLSPSMIDGTQIKQYDVILMKIPVLELMALYKKNVTDSLYKLDMVQGGAVAAAQQSFADLIDKDPMARSGLNKTRIASGREPVTFSHT